MSTEKAIKSALISVYHKDNLDEICKKLNELGVQIYSTGGTQSFIEESILHEANWQTGMCNERKWAVLSKTTL